MRTTVFSVLSDRVQLQQVVLNLVMNAMEAMSTVDERARELVITTRNVEPDQVQVLVEDSGIGVSADTMSRIFDPFYTTKSGGMGMGLSICRSILQAHGGRMWATPNDGPGTSFRFAFPSTTKKVHMQESQESDALIAIVDDDPSVRRGLQRADPHTNNPSEHIPPLRCSRFLLTRYEKKGTCIWRPLLQ